MALFRSAIWAAPSVVLALLGGAPARAERQHTVSEGQSLVSIAHGYRVSVSSLAAANQLSPDAFLRVGAVLSVPEQGVVVLGDGQTLWSIARRHDCTVEALARANGIDPRTPVRPGARLALPRARAAAVSGGRDRARDRAGDGAEDGDRARLAREAGQAKLARRESGHGAFPEARGAKSRAVKLVRIATQEQLRLTLTDARGRVRPQASAQLARFLKPRNSSKQRRPEPRLVALLAETADHFAGRTIYVVSGYRVAGGYTSRESRHTRGAAIDLRVEGVSNRALCDYLRHFRNVGVGFYPHSPFVHFDVREKNAYWIDLSSPGRKPSYLDREQRDHFDGKNKDEGLVELGRSIEAVLDRHAHGEPLADDPQAADD